MNKNLLDYKNQVENKYLIYNSLFLNLPYNEIEKIGILIPILTEACEIGYKAGMSPIDILEDFFNRVDIVSEKEKIKFFFRVVQYVERQVVLFDAVEDARFRNRSENEIRPLLNLLNSVSETDSSKMLNKLNNFSIRLVFTAHPTQFYPLWVLDIISELREGIYNNDFESVNDLLIQLGMTSLLNPDKPTPFEEAKNIIYYLRNVYYNSVGDLLWQLKERNKAFSNYQLIRLGFWPGGDRDGNPFVNANTTMEVADELRMTLYKCYYHDIKSIKKIMSFRGINELLESLKDKLYEAMFDASVDLKWTEIHSYIIKCKDILIKDFKSFKLSELERFEIKLMAFKSFFATLDIRQDHSVHHSLMQEVFSKYKLSEKPFEVLSEDELASILQTADIKLDPELFENDLHKDTIVNISQLKKIQLMNGEESCHRYIISNSESILSVLYVSALFKWCGWKVDEMKFDIVPLFETMIGMEESENVMNFLYKNDAYKRHLNRRNNKQTIMLGFSDGTKDGGYMKANWSIYKTKERLTRLSNASDIDVMFFDGRGGPPARGGGKSHRFYASTGKDIANNEIQLTLQGQTITSTYGTERQFTYNCEQLIRAGLEKVLQDESAITVSNAEAEIFERLANTSFDKYDALKNHKDFIPYLEEMSTLKYYSQANIGSRPSKRGKSSKLTLDDLRAISFVGSWSQLKQNVPGYFGMGSAIKSFADEGEIESLKQLFKSNKYFRALVLNSMMSLKKSYFPLTSYMKERKEFKDFWNILFDEYELSLKMCLEITGYQELMEEEPISKRSIEMRERIVLPLLSIQQYALQKVAEECEMKSSYEKIVTRSMYGNINASRNSV